MEKNERVKKCLSKAGRLLVQRRPSTNIFQIREIGKIFGKEGGPLVKFNYLHAASEWVRKPDDRFYYESFFTRLGLTDHYQFLVSDTPDYVFIGIHGYRARGIDALGYAVNGIRHYFHREGFDPSSLNYLFPKVNGPFVRIFFTTENVKANMRHCDWAFGYQYEDEIRHPNYMRLPIYVFCGPEDQIARLQKRRASSAKDGNRSRAKTRFCAFLHTHDVPVRNAIFDKLCEYKRVDAPGKARNNMPRPQSLDDNSLGGFDKSKLDFLSHYKFTIACEDSLSPGYTTEKLVQPMMVDSIPIYYGNPEVGRDFNLNSFVHLEEKEWRLPVAQRLEILLERVKRIDQDDALYQRYSAEPLLNQDQFNRISRERILQQFHRIFAGTTSAA